MFAHLKGEEAPRTIPTKHRQKKENKKEKLSFNLFINLIAKMRRNPHCQGRTGHFVTES